MSQVSASSIRTQQDLRAHVLGTSSSQGAHGENASNKIDAVEHMRALQSVARASGDPMLVGSGDNPFAALGLFDASMASSMGTLGNVSNPMDVALSSELLDSLARIDLGALELGHSKAQLRTKLLHASTRLRDGVLLTLSDGIGHQTGAGTLISRQLVEQMGRAVTDAEMSSEVHSEQGRLANIKLTMQQTMPTQFPFGMDVNAFVQAVLRESYMLQNETLKDFANKVKFFNKLKKKIRKEINRVRGMLGNASALGDEAILDEAYEPMQANMDPNANIEESESTVAPPETIEPEEEFTDGYGLTANDMERYLNAGKTLRLAYADSYVEISGVPAVATFDGIPVQIRTFNNSEGRVFELKGLRGMHPDLESIEIDSFGNMSRVRHETVVDKNSVRTVTTSRNYKKNKKGYGTLKRDINIASAHSLQNYFNSLDPKVQRAIERDWQTKGFSIDVWVHDTQGVNNKYNKSYQGSTMGAGETASEYIKRVLVDAAQAIKNTIKKKEGHISIEYFSSAIKLPTSVKQQEQSRTPFGMSMEAQGQQASQNSEEASKDDTSWHPGDPLRTKAQFLAYAESLEQDLKSVGDDAQLAHVDLQNALQKQQQTLQMMSNISKILHDTAMSIIRKIGN